MNQKIKNLSLGLLLAALMPVVQAAENQIRQVYPAASGTAVKQTDTDKMKAPDDWKQIPLIYYTVPALSDIVRVSDTYPADGTAYGDLQFIAAKNEFEPASAIFFAAQNFDRFLPVASELKSKNGAVIPASAIDIKIVKLWYQAGSAWFSQFNDTLQNRLIPELLLNDENLVIADSSTQDNYVRYANKDGSTFYQWMTAKFSVVNYHHDNQANIGLIRDADTLQPAVLNKNEFKQYLFTFHAPKDARPGVYTGDITLNADGKTLGKIPVRVRVLPFELPAPKTNYNSNKGYYLSLYRTGRSRNMAILRNQANHNALNPMGFPYLDPMHPDQVAKDVAMAKEAGLNVKPLFSAAASADLLTPTAPKGKQLKSLNQYQALIAETSKLSQDLLGHTEYYCYGVDEGQPWQIRMERAAWKAAHDAGGKVMVTSAPCGSLLFDLDYVNIPGAPSPRRIKSVREFHKGNPDGLCGWYADPHSGPENPDFFRRIHGFLGWKNEYDIASNYCWWRNNWNDSAIPYEPNYRGIIMVYAGCDNVIDTLAWEGVREGLDDVRYASYMRELALEAKNSKNPEVARLGRRLLNQLAYTDEFRSSLNFIRLEAIHNILALRKALGKGN